MRGNLCVDPNNRSIACRLGCAGVIQKKGTYRVPFPVLQSQHQAGLAVIFASSRPVRYRQLVPAPCRPRRCCRNGLRHRASLSGDPSSPRFPLLRCRRVRPFFMLSIIVVGLTDFLVRDGRGDP